MSYVAERLGGGLQGPLRWFDSIRNYFDFLWQAIVRIGWDFYSGLFVQEISVSPQMKSCFKQNKTKSLGVITSNELTHN
jgi:hypothetical protein